jgi:hypothetical protein
MKIDLKLLTEMVEGVLVEKELSNQLYGYLSEWVVYDYLAGINREDYASIAELDKRLVKTILPDQKLYATPDEQVEAFEFYQKAKQNLSKIKLTGEGGDSKSVKDIAGTPDAPPAGGTDPIDVRTDNSEIHIKYEEHSSKRAVRLVGLQKAAGELASKARQIYYTVLYKLTLEAAERNKSFADRVISFDYSRGPSIDAEAKLKGRFIDRTLALRKPDEMKTAAKSSNKINPEFEQFTEVFTDEFPATGMNVGKYIGDKFLETREVYKNSIVEDLEGWNEYLNEEQGFSDFVKQYIVEAFRNLGSNVAPGSDLKAKDALFLRFFQDGSVVAERVDAPSTEEMNVIYERTKGKVNKKTGEEIPGKIEGKILIEDPNRPSTSLELMIIEFRLDGDAHPPQIKTGKDFPRIVKSFVSEDSA